MSGAKTSGSVSEGSGFSSGAPCEETDCCCNAWDVSTKAPCDGFGALSGSYPVATGGIFISGCVISGLQVEWNCRDRTVRFYGTFEPDASGPPITCDVTAGLTKVSSSPLEYAGIIDLSTCCGPSCSNTEVSVLCAGID